VLYAGTAKFDTLIHRLGGQVRCIPNSIVHDFRCHGPTVDSKEWAKVQYEEFDTKNVKKLEHFVTDYDINLPGEVRDSWLEIKEIVREMMASLLGISLSALTDEELYLVYTKLRSLSSRPQPPHLDYLSEILADLLEDQELYLAVFPLNSDGMMLQVWEYPDDMEDGESMGQLLFLPMNSILVLPGKTVHGGGFLTSTAGNLRGHLYIYVRPKNILKGTDVKVEYGINETGVFKPNEHLVDRRLVHEYGVYDLAGNFHTAIYFD
jgi:hypothetical protein